MRHLLLFILALSFSSCVPQLHFLGDSYPPTKHVDTYYAPEDITEDFKVIGQLTGTNEGYGSLKSLDSVKNSMIEEAKKRGAHGILFLFSDSRGYEHMVKADLIRYLE